MKHLLLSLSFVYMVLTVVMGGSALLKGAIYPGLSGIIGPSLCWFAASGLKGSLMVGTSAQKVAGSVAAIIFVIIGGSLVYHSGYWVGLFGHSFSGITWCIVGFAVGWTTTARRYAEPSKE